MQSNRENDLGYVNVNTFTVKPSQHAQQKHLMSILGPVNKASIVSKHTPLTQYA